MSKPLHELRVLVLEDEYLIAMDVEQICLDSGASEVLVARSIGDVGIDSRRFDVAIVDVMLGGEPTIEFARSLRDAGVPFVFASGYTNLREIEEAFPQVSIVGKPYSGDDLVEAVARAVGR